MKINSAKLNKNTSGELVSVVVKTDTYDIDIPFDPDNTDYQQYLKWVAQGNEPLPAEEPVAPASTAAADEGVA